MQQRNFTRAGVAGLIGTAVMTMMILMAPMMGMPEMNIGRMLGEFMGIPVAIGWLAHFMIGTMLALIYVFIFVDKFQGAPWLRGALYGLAPWLVSQIMVNPMMGAGVFASNMPDSMMVVMGSLMGHLIYGAVVGGIYGRQGVHPQSQVSHSRT